MSSLPEPIYDIVYYYRSIATLRPPADLVSVVISNYNYASFVLQTLESVHAQTFANLELVVVDDCSSDSSVEVMREWLERHRERFLRVILARAPGNQGLTQTRNTAIGLSCGRKIFVLDSDNILMPRAVARHAEVLDRTGAQVTYSAFEFFDAAQQVGYGDFWDPERFRHGNYIDAMAMFSKAAWQDVGGYSHFDIMGWEDYDLWLRFVEHGFTGVFIPELLCRYRVHHRSMLRTETGPATAHLQIEITARHPWLDLEPAR